MWLRICATSWSAQRRWPLLPITSAGGSMTPSLSHRKSVRLLTDSNRATAASVSRSRAESLETIAIKADHNTKPDDLSDFGDKISSVLAR